MHALPQAPKGREYNMIVYRYLIDLLLHSAEVMVFCGINQECRRWCGWTPCEVEIAECTRPEF